MMWTYLTFVLIGSVAAQVPILGSCPNVTVKPDFDLTRFLGKWYEVQRYFSFFGIGGKCTTAEYTLNENGTIGVRNVHVYSLTGKPVAFDGYATQDEHEKAKLALVYPIKAPVIPTANWIIDTDYDSFAVVWDCKNSTIVSGRFAALLTREPHPAESVLEKAYAAFDTHGIDRSHLKVVDFKNCPESSESSA